MDNRTKTIAAAVVALTMAASYAFPAGTGDIDPRFGNAVVASAADAWNGKIDTGFAGGYGTAANPYQIATGAQLAYFAEQVNSGYLANTYFKLTDDIDLGGRKWTPIGKTGGAFNGYFDGGGHTVSGVSVSVSDHYENAGFFGFSVGVIKNLAVKGNISGVNTVGGICGGNSGIEGHGTISNCSFEGTVTGTGNNVGGICGYNFTDSKISSCFSSAAVKGAGEVGGICGYNEGGASVEASVSAGTVSGSSLVGSVCGKNDGSLSDNYFDSSVSNAVGAKDGSGNEVTSGVTGLTTSDLCDGSLPTGLTGVWRAGSISETPDPNNARMRTLTAVYPSLANIGEAHKAAGIKQYNFGIDSNEDWAEYTEINSAADLKKIGIDGSYVLMKDITLGNFTPLFGDNECFGGRFSGNGHTISGVNISTAAEETGIFSVNDGIIMDLAVKGNISGGTNAGGICGTNSGTIYSCSFEGSVNGRKKVGGISGHNTNRISNCYVIGTIKASADCAGGIGGYSESSATIGNCYFAGTVTAPDSGEKGAICSNQTATVTNCCYNKDLYTEASSGTGLTTFEMTSGEALSKMNLDTGIWTKQANNIVDSKGQNGVAYYPSLKGSTSVPSVKYTAELTFERTDDKKLAFLDVFEVKFGGKIVFANGGTETLNEDNCNLDASVSSNGIFTTIIANPGEITYYPVVSEAGESTYKFRCSPCQEVKTFLPSEGLTKSFTIKAAKRPLTANDFEFTAPTGLTYDGTAKQATVGVPLDSNFDLYVYKGYGNITVKYFDSNGKQAEPINAGEYTVKIDVSEGESCLAAKDLTADTWKFTINKAATPLSDVNDNTNVSWNASVADHPVDLGDVTAVNSEGTISSGGGGIVQSAVYSNGKVILTMAQNTEADIGKTDVITFTFTSPKNFDGTLTYNLTVTLSAKTDQAAPDANDAGIVFTSTESGITARIATALTGVEYSFDGVNWSGSNTISVGCGQNVTGYIRFAETNDKNASDPVSVSARSGHAALVHHNADNSVCVQGNISEYWECSGCGKYFSDENGTSELALAVHHTVDAFAKWESDNDEDHYHICTACHGKADVEAHTFDDGAVTLEPTETAVGEKRFICTVCGYEKREVLGMTEHVHSVGDELYSDETGHWRSCLNCGEKIDFQKHTSDNGTVEGQTKVFRCTVCGYEISRDPIQNGNEGYRPTHFDGPSFSDIFNAPMPQFREKLKAKSEVNGSTAVISWDKAEDAEKYVIYLLQNGKYKKIMTTKDTSVSVDKLKNGQTYRFMVRYIKNGELSPVTYSSKLTVNIYYKPIVTAKAAENSVSLSWKAVPGAEKYAVYKYDGGKAVKLAEVKSTSVRIDGLKPDTEYSYIVSAFVDGKWTVMTRSDIVTVTTNR